VSICRWGFGSDVYVYEAEDTEGKPLLVCHSCHLVSHASFEVRETHEMIAHLEQHRADGDLVPEAAFERLRGE